MRIYPLEYQLDLSQQYQALSHLPGFVLLESSDTSTGRYDILSACPYDVYQLPQGPVNEESVLRAIHSRLPWIESSCDLPFQGGAIGYVSYDYAVCRIGLECFAHPLLAPLPMLYFGFYNWGIVTDHHEKRVSLFMVDDATETSEIINTVQALWAEASSDQGVFYTKTAFYPMILKADYQKSFRAIHHHLMCGRAYQVNYTQPFLAEYHGNPWSMYRRVQKQNPVPFSGFLRLPEADILSFSPERFLLMDEKYLLASPIKGSLKRSADSTMDNHLKDSLKRCPKNRAENVMIVDLMRHDLGKIATPGSVRVPSLCEVQSFTGVHHLVSHIEAECRDNFSSLEAFLACFPGGSITGAPKREAMQIIAEEEPYARGVYCGSIGYFSRHGRFDTNIAIRTVVAREAMLYLSAGGGIVIDSTEEEEYLECYTKIKAIMKAL